MFSADRSFLVALVTRMVRAAGIRLPFYTRCDSNQENPLYFKKMCLKKE